MDTMSETNSEIQRLTEELLRLQKEDGSWRFCFENGTVTDAYMIIVLRTLQEPDESLIRHLHDRIAAAQQADGSWKLFHDEEEGNLSATVEAYYALLYSGYSATSDESMRKAKQYILSKGGVRSIDSLLTIVLLAATGQYPWPASLFIPLEFLLLPPSFPLNFFRFFRLCESASCSHSSHGRSPIRYENASLPRFVRLVRLVGRPVRQPGPVGPGRSTTARRRLSSLA